MQFLTAESQVIRWQIDSLFFHHLGNRQQLLHSCCKCSVVKCLCWSFEDALVFSMCEGTTYICFKFFEFHLVQLMSKIGMSHQPLLSWRPRTWLLKCGLCIWLMLLQHRRQLLKFWDMALHLASTKVVLDGLDAWRILQTIYWLVC